MANDDGRRRVASSESVGQLGSVKFLPDSEAGEEGTENA